MKKATLAIVCAALTMSLSVPVFAAAKINVKAEPTDEFRHPGETAIFIAEADSYDKLEWIFSDPNGNEYTVDEVRAMFPELNIQGANDTYFRVGNLPKEMNGCDVYCRFKKDRDEVITDEATIYVRDYAPAKATVTEPESNNGYAWYDENGNLNYTYSKGGVVTTEYFNGDRRTEYAEGVELYESADGTVTWYEEDGSFQKYDPDGGWYTYDAETDTEDWGYYYN